MKHLNRELEKEAIEPLSLGLGMLGGHIAQNIYTRGRLLTESGGKRLARSLLGKTKHTLVEGGEHAASPEIAIARDELAHVVPEVGGMSMKERTLAKHLAQGNFTRLHRIAQKNPKMLQQVAEKARLPVNSEVLQLMSKMPEKGVADMERAYKNNPVGKMANGITEVLEKIYPNELKNVKSINKKRTAGEIMANTAIAVHEPGVPILNAIKRTVSRLDNKSEVKKIGVKTMFEKPMEKGFEKGVQTGKKRNKLFSLVHSYIGNPVAGSLSDLSSEFGAIINRHLPPEQREALKSISEKQKRQAKKLAKNLLKKLKRENNSIQ